MRSRAKVKPATALWACMLAFGMAASVVEAIEWTAYNDLCWASGDPTSNITLIGTGENGELVDNSDGTGVGVNLSVTSTGAEHTDQGDDANSGTDAYTTFNGKVGCVGLIGYGGPITMTFTNLEPAQFYTLVVFGNRDAISYSVANENRTTEFVISDVAGFVNDSTAGTEIRQTAEANDTTKYCTGYNTDGLVARFINIVCGSDGDMTVSAEAITASHEYVNALMLTCQTAEILPDGDGWVSGYAYRRALTVNSGKVGGTLTDYPLLVSVVTNDLRTTGNGGDVLHASGYDIVFTLSDGETTLDHEIEMYSAAGGEYIGWVRVPTLLASVDTELYMYYGNASISVSTENVPDVWDADYVAVWHLNETPDNDAVDSAGSNDGDTTDLEADDQQAGQIHGCLKFDIGANETVNCGSHSSLDNIDNLTVSACVSPFDGNAPGVFAYKEEWRFWSNSEDLRFRYKFSGSGGATYWHDGNANRMTGNTWQHVAVTYNRTSIDNDPKFYHNGDLLGNWQNDPLIGTANDDSGYNLLLGKVGESTYEGKLDEVRISKIRRSGDWLATCQANMLSPNTFLGVGGAEVPPPALAVSFAAAPGSVNEDAGSKQVSVQISAESGEDVRVDYATSNGSATAGEDYTGAGGTLTWLAGDTANKSFSVSITDDALDETSETLSITLSGAINGTITGTNPETLTIVDNDDYDTVKIAKGSTWKYRKGTDEASDPATDWRRRMFDDSGWSSGVAPIGYGDRAATTLADMKFGYSCVFYRQSFSIGSPDIVEKLKLDVDYDDAFIAWVNGEEVARVHMDGSTGDFMAYTNVSASNQSGSWSNEYLGAEIPQLVPGANVLAAQLFNRSLDSGDADLDIQLSVVEGHFLYGDDDADDDDMDDLWEADTCPGGDGDPAVDYEPDGLSTLQEYVAGTDPNDAASCFALEVDASGPDAIISFDTVDTAGVIGYSGMVRRYTLERRLDLFSGGLWVDVPGYANLPGNGSTVSYTNPPGQNVEYYRARVWLE